MPPERPAPADSEPSSTYQTQVQLTVRDGLVIDILQIEDDAPPTS